MEELGFGSLWLQVLLVALATFFASAVFWTIAPWHETEYRALPNEEAIRQALHEQGVTEGQWRIPFSENADDWKTPEFMARFATGPVGVLQLERPAPMSIAPRLLKTFLLYLFVAFFTAYVLRQAVESGDSFLRVFQLAGAVSFGAHAIGSAQDAIWFGKSWRRVLLHAADSVIYALITAAIFAWMWPWA